jgi:hypothetical protein
MLRTGMKAETNARVVAANVGLDAVEGGVPQLARADRADVERAIAPGILGISIILGLDLDRPMLLAATRLHLAIATHGLLRKDDSM